VHTTNGTAPPDPIEQIIGDLEQHLAPISARKAQLESEIADLLKQESRIKGGIAALRQGAPRSAPARNRPDSHAWMPSQKTIDDIYAVIATADEPLTISQITEQASVSSSTVKKTIDHLRSEQKIRICGTAATQGSPKIYGPMK
jgi:hypothetical protein